MKKILLAIIFLLFLTYCNIISKDTLWTEIRIPVRDGYFLAADLYSIDTTVKKPIILIQTPYNKNYYRVATQLPPQSGGNSIIIDTFSYNFVVLDWRGFYGSKDAEKAGYDRGFDGYDVVEWLAAQNWCNGKVGAWGSSALGLIQFQTAKQHPPHLVCAVPQVKDYKTKYSDYYYGGVFRREHVETMEKLGFLTVDAILSHPTHDNVWKIAEQSTDYPEEIEIPMLLISGWFDHYPSDVMRAFNDLKNRSAISVRNKHKLIMGPWTHSGLGALKQGELEYPEAIDIPIKQAQRFFDYHILGAKNAWPLEPTIRYYQMGEDIWKSIDDWYKVFNRYDTLYLQKDKSLTDTPPPPFMPPFEMPLPDTIIYNPINPSPTVGGSRFSIPLPPNGPLDIRQAVESRSDVLIYSTPPLEREISITGIITVVLYIKSDCKDTDFGVRLCDVYPDGRSMLITQGMRRKRFINDYEDEVLMEPNTFYRVDIELSDLAITFLPGHQLRIVLSSSNYPMFDINLNNGGELYKAGDTITATNLIYCTAEHPSKIIFPTDQPTSVERISKSYNDLQLYIFPNPVNNSSNLYFNIENEELITIKLFDGYGREIKTILNEKILNGENNIPIDLTGLSSGLYFLKFQAGIRVEVEKILKQ